MDDPVVISLLVSGIGMLVLFLALAFLYGLMSLMTRFIKDRPEPSVRKQGSEEAGNRNQEAGGRAQKPGGEKWRIAAIGVALARAEIEMSGVDVADAKATPRGWRALHHRRQLTLNTYLFNKRGKMGMRMRRGR
jgi:Na+-transporting methylmalonyl-CoA/oxaloacetate decarboxylase gamma subunit